MEGPESAEPGAALPILRSRARIAVAGPLGFLAGVVAMHFLRDDLNPARRRVSEYATGDFGWAQSLAFLSLAAGGFALAACVRAVPAARRQAALLALFGFGMIVVTLFPADPASRVGSSANGDIHGAAASVAFGALLLAMVTLIRPLRRDGRFGRFAFLTGALWVPALAFFAVQAAVPKDEVGLWQRFFIGSVLLWLLAAGLRYLRVARSGSLSPSAGA